MIRAEDVADLREGDVVELSFSSGAMIRGPLVVDRHRGDLEIADVGWTIRLIGGGLGFGLERAGETLTVVSRAPRPLYVNHDRTEPGPGDVVRDADDESDRRTWTRNVPGFSHEWHANAANIYVPREKLPARLRLLVDGTTGQVVP